MCVENYVVEIFVESWQRCFLIRNIARFVFEIFKNILSVENCKHNSNTKRTTEMVSQEAIQLVPRRSQRKAENHSNQLVMR